MSVKNIEIRFHLVGGQTVTILMPAKEGEMFDAADFEAMAEQFRDAQNLNLSDTDKWSLAIPSMANVAMVEFVRA